jgi:hypothetical protein
MVKSILELNIALRFAEYADIGSLTEGMSQRPSRYKTYQRTRIQLFVTNGDVELPAAIGRFG